jgi:hypothetical protein
VLLALSLSAACTPTGPTPSLNESFVLAPGETATLESVELRIRFVSVTGDSRCPADVVCIQGGDAIVHIRVSAGGGTRSHELHTGDMRPVMHDGFTIELVELQPYPFSSRTIRPEEYRATLRAR